MLAFTVLKSTLLLVIEKLLCKGDLNNKHMLIFSFKMATLINVMDISKKSSMLLQTYYLY